jgi:hypothetical protein
LRRKFWGGAKKSRQPSRSKRARRGTAALTASVALGALADQVGLSRAYLIAPILAIAVLSCFVAARALERRGAYGLREALQ